jgi:hypothetical protein
MNKRAPKMALKNAVPDVESPVEVRFHTPAKDSRAKASKIRDGCNDSHSVVSFIGKAVHRNILEGEFPVADSAFQSSGHVTQQMLQSLVVHPIERRDHGCNLSEKLRGEKFELSKMPVSETATRFM